MDSEDLYEREIAKLKEKFQEEARKLKNSLRGSNKMPEETSLRNHTTHRKRVATPIEQTSDEESNNDSSRKRPLTFVTNTSDEDEVEPKDSVSFRKDLNRRMGVPDGPDKKKAERIKRARRQFVLEECLKRNMDLRQKFTSYSWESKMYSVIKGITAAAPPEWNWDRSVTTGVIRTLCWDRVRSKNRRDKQDNPQLKSKIPNTQNTSRKRVKKTNNRISRSEEVVRESSIDSVIRSDDRHLDNVPRTYSRAAIPAVVTERNLSAGHPTSHPTTIQVPTSPIRPFAPYVDHSSPIDRGFEDTPAPTSPKIPDEEYIFRVKIGGRSFRLTKDTNFDQFKDMIKDMLPIRSDELCLYKALAGSKQDMSWKTLNFAEEYNKMITKYINVGVRVKRELASVYYCSDAEVDISEPEADRVDEGKSKPTKAATSGKKVNKIDSPNKTQSPQTNHTIQVSNMRVNLSASENEVVASSSKRQEIPAIFGDSQSAPTKRAKTTKKPSPKTNPPRKAPQVSNANEKRIQKAAQTENSLDDTSFNTITVQPVKKTTVVRSRGGKSAAPTKPKRPVGRPPSKRTLSLRSAQQAALKATAALQEAEQQAAAKKAEEVENTEHESELSEVESETQGEDHDSEENSGAQMGGPKNHLKRRSSRTLTKSRIYQDQENYQKKLDETDMLKRAREQLKAEWADFEGRNPPGYISHLPTSRSVTI